MKYFNLYPNAIITVTLCDLVMVDTLKRCIAYGGHDAYVEGRTVVFTSVNGFDQFKLAFEDLFESMEMISEKLPANRRDELLAYREALS